MFKQRGARSKRGAQSIGAVGAIGQTGLRGEASDQIEGDGRIATVTGPHDEPSRATAFVDDHVDLGCQSAARASDGVRMRPPFAPAAER